MPSLLNAALLFDEGQAAAFVDYSARLCRDRDCDVVLGAGNLPHLTLLQFEAEGDLEQWRDLGRLATSPLPLALAGLTFVPSRDGHVWLEIQVLKSRVLEACQQRLVAAVGERPIHNGTGDAFRPHITLGRVRSTRTIGSFQLEDAVVGMKDVRGRLAVGRAGDNYAFLEEL